MDNGSIIESNLPIVEAPEIAITDKEENEAPIVEPSEAETVDREENQEAEMVDREEVSDAVLPDEEEDDMQDATVRVPAISATKAGVEL